MLKRYLVKLWKPLQTFGQHSQELCFSCTELSRVICVLNKLPELFFLFYLLLWHEKIASLKYISHAIQFTHSKCIIQLFWYFHRVVRPTPQSILKHFHHPKRNPIPISNDSPFPPALDNHKSTFCLHRFAYSRHFK